MGAREVMGVWSDELGLDLTIGDAELFFSALSAAGYAILSPDEVRAIQNALNYAREGFTVAGSMPLSDADTVEAIDAAIRSLKGGRDAQ